MPLKQIVGPGVEPVSAAEVVDAARIDDAAFNAQAALAIKAMRSQAEARTGRALITQTLELVLDAFPAGEVDLVVPRVQSIVSVKYIDTAGNEQTLASNRYTLGEDGTSAEFSWLFPASGTTWPDTYAQANAVRVQFNVGFGDAAADVPEDIRLWIQAHVVQILQAPDGLIDQAFRPLPFVDRLLDQHIVYRVF